MRPLLLLSVALFSVAASAQSTSHQTAQPNAESGAIRDSGTANSTRSGTVGMSKAIQCFTKAARTPGGDDFEDRIVMNQRLRSRKE
jgi:hypothetical protein